MCVRARVCGVVRACVRACMCVCAWFDVLLYMLTSMLHSFKGTASIHFVVGGGCIYSFGFFFKPIQQRFDASAEEITWIPAIMLCVLFLSCEPFSFL